MAKTLSDPEAINSKLTKTPLTAIITDRWSIKIIDHRSVIQQQIREFSKMTWQRARQPDQKAERITAILNAAGSLFDQSDLNDVSMNDVAKAAGLSKGSLYSYFKTKEEVFATLFLQEMEGWFGDVGPRIRRLRSPSAGRLVKVLTDVLRDRHRFCRLATVLSSVLERNMSTEFVRDFKRELNLGLGQVIALLQTAFPGMTDEAGMVFLYQHQALLAGLWPLTHPAPAVAEVLQEEEFQGMVHDFFQLFERSLKRLLER